METPFAGLTLEQHIYGLHQESYHGRPTEIKISKVRAIAAKTLRAWKAHRDANHNKASFDDVRRKLILTVILHILFLNGIFYPFMPF